MSLGLLILLAAQMLSAYMGVYVQELYSAYGSHWDENLFYTHAMSIPLFLPLAPSLQAQYQRLRSSPPLFTQPSTLAAVYSAPDDAGVLGAGVLGQLRSVPQGLLFLLMNAVTQLLCISGVQLLGSRSSAVTVTIVLNVRKLVSFMASIWLFGNQLNGSMVVGAALVFGSGALYGWETTVGIPGRGRSVAKRE